MQKVADCLILTRLFKYLPRSLVGLCIYVLLMYLFLLVCWYYEDGSLFNMKTILAKIVLDKCFDLDAKLLIATSNF